MVIDVLFFICLIMAVYKGYSRGFIVAVFSFFAYLIGLAAAMKLSAAVANHLQQKAEISGPWLPAFSFLLVFVAVIFLVRWSAAFIKKAFSLAMLGWIDTIAGVFLFALLYTLVLSIILFYAGELNIISQAARQSSSTYSFIAPLGPWFMKALATILPFLSDMFTDLSRFFEDASAGKR